MNETDPYLADILTILKGIAPGNAKSVTEHTNVLSDLDLDSLKMLELVEALKERFSVDFLLPPRSIRDLRTPTSIAEAIHAAAKN